MNTPQDHLRRLKMSFLDDQTEETQRRKRKRSKEQKNSISNMTSPFIDRAGLLCSAKQSYKTKKDAKRAAARLMSLPKDGANPGAQLRIYKCHHCGGAHLTSEQFRPKTKEKP